MPGDWLLVEAAKDMANLVRGCANLALDIAPIFIGVRLILINSTLAFALTCRLLLASLGDRAPSTATRGPATDACWLGLIVYSK